MEQALISTKLFIPPASSEVVGRPRLLERLAAALDHSLTLVSAPAGFGKTTLLSEWLHHSRPPVTAAWFSIEESENDPVRFWRYAVAALRTIHPAVGEAALALLSSPQPLPAPSALTPLINDLAGISQDFLLVLDDYHFIQSPPVHEGVTFLLEHLPPRMHLVIATRIDPPLPLAHFRGKGTLLEIGTDDMRFNLEEAASLLKELKAPALSPADIKALNAKAEGWVAGLKMAMLSLKNEQDIPGFIAGFTGTQRYIMDYLMEEVLQRQPPEVRDFLLKTSVLERLSGPLCDAVTGRRDGQETLISLEKANLFIVPLDETRQWYRYEHLFAELLRHRLETTLGAEKVFELHRLASRWHEGNGFREKAIDHALAAQDWERAMDLIVAADPLTFYGGPMTYNWLRQVPQDVLLTRPMAYIQCAWALVSMTRFEDAKAMLDDFEKSAAYDAKYGGIIASIRTNIGGYQADPRTEEYGKKALSLLPPDDILERAIVSLHLGIYYVFTQRINEAEPFLNETYEACLKVNNPYMTSQTLFWLAMIILIRGKLREAEEMFQRAIRMAEWHPNTALVHLYLSVVYSQWNDLEAAIAEREKAISLYPIPAILGPAHLYICSARVVQQDFGAAAAALEKAEQVLIKDGASSLDRARVAAFHVALAIAQEDHESASRWLDKLAEYEGPINDAPANIAYLLHQRWGETLQERLQAHYEQLRKEGLVYSLIPTRIEQALTASNPKEALDFLADALAMGKPEGFVRSFVDFGVTLVPLLRKTIVAGIEPDYARKLLGIIENEDRQRRIKKGETPSPPTSLLSEREMKVLRLIAEGLSNQQIAEKLFISLSTAKSHVYHIFDKLEARDRLQAVNRARELKLI